MKNFCDTDVLNAVWQKWNIRRENEVEVWNKDYTRVSRRSFDARLFEEWLFTEGVVVVQSDHKRYLRFLNEDNSTFFLLKNA